MKKNILMPFLLIAVAGSMNALADMRVDTSSGVLKVMSDISGTVIVKVIGPNDKVIVDRKYQGDSFTWIPSGSDGAYRYDIHIVGTKTPTSEESDDGGENDGTGASDYAGGSIEVVNGGLAVSNTIESGEIQ